MSRSFSSFTTLFLLVLILVTCKAKINHHHCHSSCGDELNISYPFRLKSDPKSCGFLKFELACKNNRTILQLHSAIYYVEEINYNLSLIRVVDASLQKDDCSFLPLHSLTHRNFSSRDMYYWLSHRNRPISFIYCAARQNFTPYADTEFCSKNHSSNLLLTSSQQRKFVVNNPIRVSDMEDSCSISMVIWVSSHGLKTRNTSFSVHEWLLHGTELSWSHNCYLELLRSLIPCGKMKLALIWDCFFFAFTIICNFHI